MYRIDTFFQQSSKDLYHDYFHLGEWETQYDKLLLIMKKYPLGTDELLEYKLREEMVTGEKDKMLL